MATVLEARAVITAEDKTSAAFAAIEARMAALSKAAANIGRVAAPTAAASNMAQVSAPMAQASRAVTNYATAMGDAARQSAVFAAAQKNVGAAIELGSRAAARAKTMHQIRSVASTSGMIATPFVAHEARKLAGAVSETYREFDKERRFAKAVMGISDAEQAPLIKQAIHGGATTKYNDIQFLEAQRELAARGLKREQILGFMPAAADLGQSLGLDLPSSVRQMEGAIFGFKKDVSTLDAAAASARQTADIQVKAAKISGMTPEDLTQLYKFGATPSRLAGVSEQTLLAFGAISKKANMGGDESGVAFRALMAFATAPTAGAKTAMRANGMRYADYQRNPDRLALDPFVGDVAERYGVKLDQKAKDAIGKVFANKDIISSPEKFTPAITAALRDALGGKDAKSLKSIAGEANRYRAASMQGVDVNALLRDLMTKLPGNLQLANALFGREQGARIANAFGDPETFKRMLDELDNHSAGYAGEVSAQRMAGFDGAVSRFEGATKNLETALGRSMDGALTKGYDAAGQGLQWLAELSPAAHRAAIEFGGVAAAAITVSGALKALSIANRLDGGPGLRTPGLGTLGRLGLLGGTAFGLASNIWNMDEAGKNLDENMALIDRFNAWAHSKTGGFFAKPDNGFRADGGVKPPPGFHRDFTLGSDSGFSDVGHVQPHSNLGNLASDAAAARAAEFAAKADAAAAKAEGSKGVLDRYGQWQRMTGGDHFAGDAPSGYGRDFTLGSAGGFSPMGRLQPPSNLGYMSNWDASHVAPGPVGRAPETVTITGQADVTVAQTIKAEPSKYFELLVERVEKAIASIQLTSTGHAAAALGPSMPEAAPTGQSGGH